MLFDWFNTAPLAHTGRIVLPQFNYLKQEMLQNLETVSHYYHNTLFDVKNDHVLVKMLELFNANIDRDLASYVERAEDQADEIASTLGLTCIHKFGSVFFPGPFYGHAYEVILVDDRDFDPVDAYKNWKDQQSVKVLRHPYNDLSIPRLDGNYKGSQERGVAVISISVPLLAVQFKAWWHEERRRGETQIEKRIHEFVAMYPLTNMIYSHLDIALFNRLSAHLFYGADTDELMPFKRCHPFYLIDVTKRMDFTLEKEIETLKRNRMRFDQLLEYIPAISATDLRSVIELPKTAPLRYVTWALILARLPLIRFLVRLNVVTDAHENNWYLNRLRMYLITLQQSKGWAQVSSVPVLHDIDSMIANDIEPYL